MLCLYYFCVSALFVFCPRLHVIPRLFGSPRRVLMCWYLIWHPSALPHNPPRPEGNRIFTASALCLSIAFFFLPLWGSDPAGVCPSRRLNECPEMLCFVPTGAEKKKKKSDETGGSFVPFLKSSQHRIGIVLFCISGEKKVVFNL